LRFIKIVKERVKEKGAGLVNDLIEYQDSENNKSKHHKKPSKALLRAV